MFKRVLTTLAVAVTFAGAATAGPVIVGGDDLNDHGSFSGGASQSGWLYIQNALQSLATQSTYPSNDGTIVVLGALGATPASNNSTVGDSCGAVYWPATVMTPPRTVNCIDGAANITAYLNGVQGGTNRPLVIVYPGNGASNGVDSLEEAAWASGASIVASYVAAGGGLLGHTGPYTWLTALLPTVSVVPSCSTNASLTADGLLAFPTITNANINAGPCHNTFSGNFGGLKVLALDAGGGAMILGGGAATTFVAAPSVVPVLPAWLLSLLAAGVASMGAAFLRRKRA